MKVLGNQFACFLQVVLPIQGVRVWPAIDPLQVDRFVRKASFSTKAASWNFKHLTRLERNGKAPNLIELI